MRALVQRLAALIGTAAFVLLPTVAHAAGGTTDVTIRRLEERAANPISALAQTGVDGQAWWLMAGGLALMALALVAWRIARGRSNRER